MLIFIGVVIICLSMLIAMSSLLDERLDYRNPKLYVWFITGIALQMLSIYSPYVYLKILNSLIIFTCWASFIFNKDFKKSLVLGLFAICLCVISETAIVVIDELTFKLVGSENMGYLLLINIGMAILNVVLARIKYIKELYKMFSKKAQRVPGKQVVALSLLSFIVYNIFAVMSFYSLHKSLDGHFLLFSGTALTFVSGVLVYNYFMSRQNYIKVFEKYNLSLESVREYEEVLEKYRLNSHENRNQLMTIRAMCKNKKTAEYIDALIENHLTDDEQLLLEAHKIPNGGLRGLIYSKLLVIKEKNINYDLLVSKGINNARIRKINDKLLTEICLIIGVFIDNAIEAVNDLDEKYVSIELFKEKNDILISITNNYSGYINVEKLFSLGYSTKGKNRGYGLPLVEKLVKNNRCLEKATTIVENSLIQTLKINQQKN